MDPKPSFHPSVQHVVPLLYMYRTSNKWQVFFLPLLYIKEEEQETSYKNKEEKLSSLTDERLY